MRFSERIRVAGTLISDEELSQRIDEVEAANGGEPISFFEITTALAFHAFAQTPADLTLVEVGLGGRFDATNVFARPAAAVITPVDYDHVELLGPGLAKIAWEKAGIIKSGRPVFSARQEPEAMSVIEREAGLSGAPLSVMGREFDAFEEHGRLRVQTQDRLFDLPPPSLPGDYQFANAGLATVVAASLGDQRIDEAAIARGVAGAIWPGRMQHLTKGPLAEMARVRGADLWLDGAHNPHAGRALAQACARLAARDGRPVTLIVGMLGRKDSTGFFAAFQALSPRILATAFDSGGATPARDLARTARSVGLNAEAVNGGVAAALARALKSGGPPPHVLICGSLRFVGDVLVLSPDTWPD